MSSVSYRKLWIRLAEKEMKKTDLSEKAKFSSATLAKLGRNELVALKVLVDICLYLECDIGDIVEVVPNSKEAEVVQNEEWQG